MLGTLEKIAANQGEYTCQVDTLGPCAIDNPIRHEDFVHEGERILVSDNIRLLDEVGAKLGHQPSFERAGPHAKIVHDPSWTRVGILTAGGLCPGLNNVIRGLVNILAADYGIKTVYGIRYGYAGLSPKCGYEPMMLDPEVVDAIHEKGGTILGSSRGQQDVDEMVDTLVRMSINILCVIGGDGSLRGARAIAERCLERGLKISVVGVPKTIDNDLMFVGPSFGYVTAVAEATNAIRSAHVEAKGTPHGIGLVKLMGRDSGFIAAGASLADPVVNFCLIPEQDFSLEGPTGLLQALERRFAEGKSHAVIVVAEGAGQKLIAGEAEAKDASGNVLKKDIGEFLKRRITDHFKAKGFPASVKYIDPSYQIRSVPARGTDTILCYMLARNAVHAAMAGRTNCVVGSAGTGSFTLVPIKLATIERQKVSLTGDHWRGVMEATGQERYMTEPAS